MSTRSLSTARLTRLAAIMAGHVETGDVAGLAWAVARGDEVHVGTAGVLEAGGSRAVERDSIFRISSLTKPVIAVAALILLEECRLRLDEPLDPLLPELADRQVLARPEGPTSDTVPARRPLTLRDLLTFRMGYGYDFGTEGPQPVLEAMGDLGLGVGPPAPAGRPEPGEWLRRLGTLPLQHQPGERWLYETSADVLGVLVARAADQPLATFLAERLFQPLGMKDTGFSVPAADLSRFTTCHASWSGPREVYDPPAGQWSTAPAFPSGGDGLVSTVEDYLAFAQMLRRGGDGPSGRLLSRPSVDAMTTDHLTDAQRAIAGLGPDGTLGWGFGVGVQRARTGPTRSPGTYGWDGGLGSSWANDPAEDLVGILMTNEAWSSPAMPPVVEDFWTALYAAIDD